MIRTRRRDRFHDVRRSLPSVHLAQNAAESRVAGARDGEVTVRLGALCEIARLLPVRHSWPCKVDGLRRRQSTSPATAAASCDRGSHAPVCAGIVCVSGKNRVRPYIRRAARVGIRTDIVASLVASLAERRMVHGDDEKRIVCCALAIRDYGRPPINLRARLPRRYR